MRNVERRAGGIVDCSNRKIERKPTLAEQETVRNLSRGATDVVPNELVDLVAEEFGSGHSYERRILRHSSLRGTTADEVEFEETLFDSTDLSKTAWRRLHLRKVRLEKCDLANLKWSAAMMDRVDLTKCRGTGMQLLDASCTDLAVSNSKINLAAFHGSRFKYCRFEGCDLRESNFEGVTLNNVVFRNCDLRAARFSNCSFSDVDLRGSKLAGMQVDPSKLRGARIEPAQLLDLAELFGVIVETLDGEGDLQG